MQKFVFAFVALAAAVRKEEPNAAMEVPDTPCPATLPAEKCQSIEKAKLTIKVIQQLNVILDSNLREVYDVLHSLLKRLIDDTKLAWEGNVHVAPSTVALINKSLGVQYYLAQWQDLKEDMEKGDANEAEIAEQEAALKKASKEVFDGPFEFSINGKLHTTDSHLDPAKKKEDKKEEEKENLVQMVMNGAFLKQKPLKVDWTSFVQVNEQIASLHLTLIHSLEGEWLQSQNRDTFKPLTDILADEAQVANDNNQAVLDEMIKDERFTGLREAVEEINHWNDHQYRYGHHGPNTHSAIVMIVAVLGFGAVGALFAYFFAWSRPTWV